MILLAVLLRMERTHMAMSPLSFPLYQFEQTDRISGAEAAAASPSHASQNAAVAAVGAV